MAQQPQAGLAAAVLLSTVALFFDSAAVDRLGPPAMSKLIDGVAVRRSRLSRLHRRHWLQGNYPLGPVPLFGSSHRITSFQAKLLAACCEKFCA
jgi:hypothetical protein